MARVESLSGEPLDVESKFAGLPRVVEIIDVTDHGPCTDGPTASCPHCGAFGRYIYTFQCADGTVRAAMRGCFSKFPQHPVVQKIRYYVDKWKDYEKKGWKLSSFDQKIADAINGMRLGQLTADDVMATIKRVQVERDNWKRRRAGY